jgi:hypothetical protein
LAFKRQAQRAQRIEPWEKPLRIKCLAIFRKDVEGWNHWEKSEGWNPSAPVVWTPKARWSAPLLTMIPVRENSEVVIIYPEFTWDYIHIVNIFVKMVENVVYLSQHYPGEKSTLIIFLSVEACVFLLGGSDESWWRYWLLMDWGKS